MAARSAALEDVQLLPKGVRALMYRQGMISEIGNRYASNYQLASIQYRTSRRIDSSMIQEINPEFKELVEIMNQEFPGYNLGDKVYLGDLIIEGEPEIDFQAPIFAIGVTDRYTLGLAIPILRFRANIRARVEGQNNIAQIKAAMPSQHQNYRGEQKSFSERLDDAYRQLEESANLGAKVEQLCAQKSLRCLGSFEQNAIGDVQLIHRYLIHQDPSWALMFRSHMNLPTGPEDDPDNLVDLPIFHRSFFDNMLVSQYRLGQWRMHNSLGYVFQVPDQIRRRVPRSAADLLPDQDRTERLSRKIGDTFKYQFNAFYQWNEDFSVAAGLQKEWKASDRLRGQFLDRDYSLLEQNTDAEFLRLEMGLIYTTIQSFLKKQFPIPLAVTYNFSDIVTGRNVERQSMHEFNLAVMF